jgi:hypothetical protein
MLGVEAEVRVGAAQHTAARDDLRASVREPVERGVVLGDPHRIERAEQRDARAEPQPRGARRDRREHHGRRGQDVVAQMVFAEPDRIEAELLGAHRVVDDLAVALRGCRLRAGVRVGKVVPEHEQAFAHRGSVSLRAGIRWRAEEGSKWNSCAIASR